MDSVCIDQRQSLRLGVEIGPARESRAHADVIIAPRHLGNARGSLVFGDVAGFKPGGGDFRDAGIFQLRDVVVRQHASFAERQITLVYAMGEDRAGCLSHGGTSELHGANLGFLGHRRHAG